MGETKSCWRQMIRGNTWSPSASNPKEPTPVSSFVEHDAGSSCFQILIIVPSLMLLWVILILQALENLNPSEKNPQPFPWLRICTRRLSRVIRWMEKIYWKSISGSSSLKWKNRDSQGSRWPFIQIGQFQGKSDGLIIWRKGIPSAQIYLFPEFSSEGWQNLLLGYFSCLLPLIEAIRFR